jgi:hypothetical protein
MDFETGVKLCKLLEKRARKAGFGVLEINSCYSMKNGNPFL